MVRHQAQLNVLCGDVVGSFFTHSSGSVCFFNLCLWLNQEFDNADGEDCSGGSSPIQEDSLSSCPSLPEVYTLPVRDRPNCPNLKDGAGTKENPSQPMKSSPFLGSAARVASLLKQILIFSGTMMGENCALVLEEAQI